MSPTHFRVKSLSGKIFSSVLVFAFALVLAFGVAMTSIYYYSYERDAEAKLSALAHDAAAYLNATPSADNVPALEEQFAGLVRYTLIAQDGAVLFDSAADEGVMENHGERPEVLKAEAEGAGAVVRYSETLKTDTVYAAVKLQDGSVVRLSETRESLLAFLGSRMAPILVALVVVAVLVFLLSKTLTRRIMKPIDALNFADPLENEIYEEMDPLLERIDEQQKLLKQQNKELALAENLRRDFSSNVSHEMKTPLQVISGYAELMKNDLVEPSDRQKFAALIYEEAQAMRSLINDVLTLSRLDETTYDAEAATPIDVRAVAERVVGRLASFASKQGVEVRVEGERACISGSATLVEEMLYNLIENGIRYNHEGGQVVMAVSVEEGAPDGSSAPSGASAAGGSAACALEFDDAVESGRKKAGRTMASGAAARQDSTSASAARHVVVRVSDTGPGIPADMQDKVFERFFRVDKSRSKETGGTGLGLAIVKHAVLYHNGTIEVESEEGQGTTFVLRMPAAK